MARWLKVGEKSWLNCDRVLFIGEPQHPQWHREGSPCYLPIYESFQGGSLRLYCHNQEEAEGWSKLIRGESGSRNIEDWLVARCLGADMHE